MICKYFLPFCRLSFHFVDGFLCCAEAFGFVFFLREMGGFLKKMYLFYLFLAVLGLCCCAWAFSSCGERGLLFVVVHGLLIAVASLVAEHGL